MAYAHTHIISFTPVMCIINVNVHIDTKLDCVKKGDVEFWIY